jgi:Holliday junction resolvasome RuvABC endonuclease subunit
MPSILILGIDPAIDIGKPMAMALVQFDGDQRIAKNWCDGRVGDKYIKDRTSVWGTMLYAMLRVCHNAYGRYPDMVAIEDVRARGRGGSHLETLVTCLCEEADALGVRCEKIHPSTVKKEATGNGRASTEEVAKYVRLEYVGMDKVPHVAGEYDIEMAVAVAGAGYAMLIQEALV